MNSQILTYQAHCLGGRQELCGGVLEAATVTLQNDLTLNLPMGEASKHLGRTSC